CTPRLFFLGGEITPRASRALAVEVLVPLREPSFDRLLLTCEDRDLIIIDHSGAFLSSRLLDQDQQLKPARDRVRAARQPSPDWPDRTALRECACRRAAAGVRRKRACRRGAAQWRV